MVTWLSYFWVHDETDCPGGKRVRAQWLTSWQTTGRKGEKDRGRQEEMGSRREGREWDRDRKETRGLGTRLKLPRTHL